MSDLESIGARLRAVKQAVDVAAHDAGRHDTVALIAVTKTVPVEKIQAAYDAGQRIFGENRVFEADQKRARLDSECADAAWYLIGHLQTNKAKPAVDIFDLIQSVDSVRLATRLDQIAGEQQRRVPVLLEVNVAAEASKQGFLREAIRKEFAQLVRLPHLTLCGLMTVAPVADDAAAIQWVFRDLRQLRDELRERFDASELTELSMGMSNDFEAAVKEGATMVRIGRAIFGDRPR